MKVIKIEDKEYKIEFTFEAAECKDHVQNMFNVMSGAYLVRRTEAGDIDDAGALKAMVDGSAEMVADIPKICRVAFYAGMLENNPVSEDEAKGIMKKYMKENKLSFYRLFNDLRKWMEDDGFFELSGLTEMIQQMNGAAEKQAEKAQGTTATKKSTSTK